MAKLVLHTYEKAFGSWNLTPGTENIPLECLFRKNTLEEMEGGPAMREVQLLTMGFILAFLGAIVVGVF